MSHDPDFGYGPERAAVGAPAVLESVRRPLEGLAEFLAIVGGFFLLLVTAATVTSVVGRAVFASPILGDAEIVEIGSALAIFSFLPYCQLRGGNIVVDVFTTGASWRTRALLDAVNGVVFTLVILLLTWRTLVGGIDAFGRTELSMFLRIPTWWGYAGASLPMIVWGCACLYTALRFMWDAGGHRGA